MENDPLSEAEASTRPTYSDSKAHGTFNKGHDAAVEGGGVEGGNAHEDTPLLSRDETAGNGTAYNDPPSTHIWSGDKDFKGLPWWRRPSVFWLIPALALNALALGGILVPKINLILNLICNNYLAERASKDPGFKFEPVMFDSDSNPQCKTAHIQKLVASFTLAMSLLAGISSALISPKLGVLSDRYGRVYILVCTTFGTLAGEIVTVLAAKYPETFSVYWILAGSAFDGLCGTFITAMAVSNAYASDCTPPGKRGVVFGWLHGCLFTGIAIGPLLAAKIIERTHNTLSVFYAALAVHATVVVYFLLFVPDSVSKERQLAARSKSEAIGEDPGDRATGEAWWLAVARQIRRGGGLFTPLSILWPKGPGSSPALRRNLSMLAAVDTVVFGVAMGALTVVVLYFGYAFSWTTVDTSYFIAIVNVCRVIVLLVILPGITRIVRGRIDHSIPVRNTGSDALDLALIRVSLVFDILAFVGYSTAKSSGMLIAAGCIGSLGGMGSPTLQSSLTKHVPADRVGQALGAMGLLHGLARVVSPTIFNLIYAATVKRFPQAVFVCLASAFGVALIISLFIRPHVYAGEFDSDVDDDAEPVDGTLR